jgi:chemotaxis protein MotA
MLPAEEGAVKFVLGLVVVIGCVLGGFVLHHGQLMLLFVPTEYLIISGMAIGAMVAANPGHVLVDTLRQVCGVFKGAPGRKHYVELLQMIYELMQLARKEGVLALEGHVNQPHESSIMSKYPSFTRDHESVHFLCDTLKLFVAGVLEAHALDELMERDLEILSHEDLEPSKAIQTVADGLPAIGIVAAVLGIILTMQAIDQGPAAVGVKVAGALVGTFLGVFLAYGVASPLSLALAAAAHGRGRYRSCIRHVLNASVSGVNPPMAVEIGRRNIAIADRPSFEELEEALRQTKGS